ncbi:c-type cytochrome [Prosthecobacter vanneervenii]|uniref:Mono/diheme cytochrome c family protein n=1 Tax=Prosthecobacter vanneervenii TaxID=48466 RepID=A0A7W7Y776_9BACT|nr:c-type cytochrome [Prosthecobacter vanneervenii]MBB5030908.1 mono/diheme cytochrome c family protein [Prosthecobacter vanneervenii]
MNSSKLCTLFAASAFFSGHLQAHPLQAEPINHAFVYTFDQFHIPQDPDESLVNGGLLLLAELNCTACHTAPASWQQRLVAKEGPRLGGVGSRLDADTLWLMIRSPQTRKKGTQMPGLFHGAEGDDEKVEALVEYLSAMKWDAPQVPAGDAERGKDLYHKVGCVACHEPGKDVRPPKAAPDAEVEKPGNASVPIALADAYDFTALSYFLRHPLAIRPSGRMPDMRLTEQEASDIAAYLHTGRISEKATARAALKIPPQGIAKGRAVFEQMNCIACHKVDSAVAAKATSKPLKDLSPSLGCMAEKQPSGTPRYDLNDLEKRALTLALKMIQQQDAPQLTAQEKVDWQMTRLNCYACHDRDGKGGPEDPRAQYFGVSDPGAESLGHLANLPPTLDKAGRKLTRDWFEKILWGTGGSVRPYMDTHMPSFGRDQTEMLITWLNEADALQKPVQIDVSGLAKHHRAELGRQLLGAKGLACVSCHGLKDRKSLGPPVIRLTHTVERLQPEYFKELLLNPQATQTGTVMPPMFVGRKTADKDIESIWTYLREIDGQPLPEGLMSAADFELKPDSEKRPIIFRSFIEGVGTHAIGVGFPGGLNAAFDAKTSRWAILWKGRFLDAMSNWQDRTMPPIKPLGTDVKELPAATGTRIFRGYTLAKDGIPTFKYLKDGQPVEDTLRPTASGFEHIITINGKQTKEILSW